jgi:hypothetical protein
MLVNRRTALVGTAATWAFGQQTIAENSASTQNSPTTTAGHEFSDDDILNALHETRGLSLAPALNAIINGVRDTHGTIVFQVQRLITEASMLYYLTEVPHAATRGTNLPPGDSRLPPSWNSFVL